MLTFKNYNIADWFSFYRIFAAPFLVLIIWSGQRELFTWLLLLSYSTDMIDGFLARKLKITSPRGSQLDSMGDQITLVVGFIGLLRFEFEFISEQYQWILIPFVLYCIQMIIAFKKYRKATAFHTYLAKLSAVIQAVFILWLLFFGPVYWLFYTMIIIGIVETIEEILLIFLYPQWVAGVKGYIWARNDKRRERKQQEEEQT
ncbi:CDP-alcohol phosphatidyltransferase family protein [Lutimonas sp.]|jgi:CDP-diacylglycerol--glycerol-3-phosphate 3-phosphatidyltransferase|uniref:CDP-alcohol phosphatidyltransferase family protein n=1 Tax=Lutimonas sp. TaxID=1872403 RepID=UPI003C761562